MTEALRTARRAVLAGLAALAVGPAAGVAQETLLRDVGSGLQAFAKDGWDVITFPTRLDQDGWLRLGGVLAVGGLLYTVDGNVVDFLERHESNDLRRGLREVGEFFEPVGLMGNTNRFYVAGIVAGYATGWKPLQHVAQDILVSHYIAGLTRNTVRAWVGRARPEDGLGPRHYDPGEYTSFPSGHSSSIFQVAAVLSHHIDRWPVTVALYGMAASVAFQRIDSGGHWPSDVWMGAAWGLGVSKVVLANAEARRRSVTPIVDPGTGMIGLSIPTR